MVPRNLVKICSFLFPPFSRSINPNYRTVMKSQVYVTDFVVNLVVDKTTCSSLCEILQGFMIITETLHV